MKDEDLARYPGHGKLENLSILDVRNNPKLTEKGIASLLPLPNLTELYVDDCAVTPALADCVKQMPKLHSLSMNVEHWPEAKLEELHKICPVVRFGSSH